MAPRRSRGHCPPGSGHRAPGRDAGSGPGSGPLARAGAAALGRGLRISPVGGRGCSVGHEGTQKPAVRMAPAMSPACCRVISSPQNSLPCPSVVTYPTDHINKVRQERSDLGVGLQVLEGDLKRKGPHCTGSVSPKGISTFFSPKGQFSTYALKF